MRTFMRRANSSPSLAKRQYYANNHLLDNHVNRRNFYDEEGEEAEEEDQFFVIGDRVHVDGFRAGSVAYFGETQFGPGDWVGVVLDEATGQHAGKLHGREYFQCAPNHGLFVRPHRVVRLSDSALGSSAASSRCGTPLPSASHNYQRFRYAVGNQPSSRASSRASTGSSQLDCYYYDDDYRQERAPTVASLTRKLKSIEERPGPRFDHMEDDSRAMSVQYNRPVGILKKTSTATAINNNSARLDELDRRLRASSASPTAVESVFNFRPRREQLTTATVAHIEPEMPARRSVTLNAVSRPLRCGDRVLVSTERGHQLGGLLRFMGETKFATGEWAGVELDEPLGKNDGSILGARYFHCPANYGLFVPASRVKRDNRNELPSRPRPQSSIFSAMRSTIKSPPPRVQSNLSRSPSLSADYNGADSRSTTPSYRGQALQATRPRSTSDSWRSQLSSSMSPIGSQISGSPSSSRPITTDLDDLYVSDYYERKLPVAQTLYDDNWRSSRAKFDDHDIELKLKQSLNRSASGSNCTSSASRSPKPKAVEYTFISSKLDGAPIARKKLIYE